MWKAAPRARTPGARVLSELLVVVHLYEFLRTATNYQKSRGARLQQANECFIVVHFSSQLVSASSYGRGARSHSLVPWSHNHHCWCTYAACIHGHAHPFFVFVCTHTRLTVGGALLLGRSSTSATRLSFSCQALLVSSVPVLALVSLVVLVASLPSRPLPWRRLCNLVAAFFPLQRRDHLLHRV